MGFAVNTILKARVYANQVRFYPRWSQRTPVKVYTPEEYQEIEKKETLKAPQDNLFSKYGDLKPTWKTTKKMQGAETEPLKYKSGPKRAKAPLVATNQKSKVKSTIDMLETVIDQDGNFIYTKMKNNDQRVGTILSDVKSKKEKDKDLILLEGKRLIKDALQCGCYLKYIIFSRQDEVEYLKPFLPKIGAQLYKMPYREMQMWSDLTTTPGIMGIFKVPNLADYNPQNPLPITIICDNIREPGNLGTILRVCAAVGCHQVILTKGCVNLWDSKVLRSSVGAHFKLRIRKGVEWKEIEDLIGEGANLFVADNKVVSDSKENTEGLVDVLEQVPLLPYYGVDFRSSENIVMVIGGETMGISRDSYELALKTQGVRLNIPLSNDVDSLNVGAALSVIAFEVKRQLTQK